MKKPGKLHMLDRKKHGIGGATYKFPAPRKQDKRAKSEEYYVVAFFPKFQFGMKASIGFFDLRSTISASPDAAVVRFMDGIRQGEKWSDYAKAGHRVRKVRVVDLGDAGKQNERAKK